MADVAASQRRIRGGRQRNSAGDTADVLLKAVHPPAVSTALAFAMHLDPTDSFLLFAMAVGITARSSCFSERCRG
jgi:hypothetical protein